MATGVSACKLRVRNETAQQGDLAPDFSLPDVDGKPHVLSTMLANEKPVVLLFYVGHW